MRNPVQPNVAECSAFAGDNAFDQLEGSADGGIECTARDAAHRHEAGEHGHTDCETVKIIILLP